MTEPRDPLRLAEPGSDAPEELRSLFESARLDLPAAARLDAIRARLPKPPPGTSGPTPAPHGVRSVSGKLVFATIGLGLVGGALWWLSSATPPTAPVEPSAAPPPPSSMVTPPSAGSEPPERRSEAPATSASAPPAPSVEPRTTKREPPNRPSRSANEAALLEDARRALGENPKRALALARRHEREFPSGVLRQEREVIAIEALRRLGQSAEATTRADEFKQEFPNSAHGRTVERGLEK